MPTKPVVSVLLPAYNAERYLPEALESILAQSFTDFEVVVIDDCSTDGTWKLIQKYAKQDKRVVAVQNQHNLKLSGTLNRAIEVAHGKYLARMDADDWSYPDRLEKQVSFMEKHPAVGICGGSMEVCDQELHVVSVRRYHQTDGEIRSHLFRYSPYSHPLVMYRKDVLEKVGGYRDEFNPAEDYELYFRIGMVAQFANLPDILLKYRVIPKSMTTGGTRKMEEKTIAIRYLYAKNYKMSLQDLVYTWLHQLTLLFIPSSWKIWAFNKFRNVLVQ